MKRLLVSGFEPFLGEKINPSQILADEISKQAEFLNKIETIVLPVSFKAAPEILWQKWQSDKFDGLVMLGQASGRDKISLERVALNWVESRANDETGFAPTNGPIDPTDKEAYFCDWPLGEIKQKLENQKLPIEISFSAGAFVCNYLYFKMASRLRKISKPCVFIHVPYLPEQGLDQTAAPKCELAVMRQAIFESLRCLLSWTS